MHLQCMIITIIHVSFMHDSIMQCSIKYIDQISIRFMGHRSIMVWQWESTFFLTLLLLDVCRITD